METTYTYEARVRRRGGSRVRHAKEISLAPKERRRLIQLCTCVALFGLVFFGRGILPGETEQIKTELLGVIRSDTDFRSAFEHLGKAISEGEPVTATLGTLWADVLGQEAQATPVLVRANGDTLLAREERLFLASKPGAIEVLSRRFRVEQELSTKAVETPLEAAGPLEQEVPPIEKVPLAETVPLVEEVTLPPQPLPVQVGPAMPSGATMEHVDLKLDSIVSPVVAALASSYGWREHPIAGGEKFHSGVDLAADYGSPIAAFADGVVDYIGESPAYGQYLQLKHSNGVTSFYAHCSKLCVKPGESVSAGDTVAEVGDSGNVTGTHLHLEVKQNGTFINPLYYIKTRS